MIPEHVSQALVLQDGLGSLFNIATASLAELVNGRCALKDCGALADRRSLDREVARQVQTVFIGK